MIGVQSPSPFGFLPLLIPQIPGDFLIPGIDNPDQILTLPAPFHRNHTPEAKRLSLFFTRAFLAPSSITTVPIESAAYAIHLFLPVNLCLAGGNNVPSGYFFRENLGNFL
jgi:hypothetical protein